jgi:hypothetical protein
MNPELLTCQRLTAGLIYPPLAIQPQNLNRLYALVTERYPYQALQHLPDGVRMSNPDNDCFVQLGRVQVNENILYFQASKEKCLEIFQIVRDNLNIQQFLTFGIKLVAFLPLSRESEAADFLAERLFAVSPRQWDLLGGELKGAGVRIVLHRDAIYELKIEPFFSDLSQLYVELDIQHPQPFDNLTSIADGIDAAYDYMFTDVRAFLTSLDPRR